MKFPRSSGILLHPTSLPSPFGIGDLGPEAYRFADFLAQAGQSIWQVLPLGPPCGDSPYQCFSSFAGNPLLISLEQLGEEQLLSAGDLRVEEPFAQAAVDYGRVREHKIPLLKKSFHNFKRVASAAQWEEFDSFCRQNSFWLDDYALFMALKDAHHGAVWTRWDRETRLRKPVALASWRRQLSDEIHCRQFQQYQFFKQWERLRQYCRPKKIALMGDMPIFVAHDSADVWANPELFRLDEHGDPTAVAGVPPDYFSPTGQLWGNPLYRWEVLAENGYRWWMERLRFLLSLVDMARLDHFRGFQACWEVPASETTAIKGRWTPGPGAALFEAIREALGELPLLAENLGVITPEVESLRIRFGFPGMAILQFAFSENADHPFLPHNYGRDLVVYTGTHDNDTTVGWWTSSGGEDSTRTAKKAAQERELARKYLDLDDRQVHWGFIRAALASVADVAIIPVQDVLGLGSEARMNRPGQAEGNWRWRFSRPALRDDIRTRLRELTFLYGRLPQLTGEPRRHGGHGGHNL